MPRRKANGVPDASPPREEPLRLALEAADLGIFEHDPVSGETRWLERCSVLLGTDELEGSLEALLEVVHPDDRADLREGLEHALDPAGPGELRAEFRIASRGGRWLAALGRAEFAGDGAERRAVRLAGVLQDVTERRRAERERVQAARAETERQRLRLLDLFLQVPAAVAVVHGPDLVFELANDAYRQLVGTQRELTGRPLLEALPDMDAGTVGLLRQVMRSGEPFRAHDYPLTLDWNEDGRSSTRYLDIALVPLSGGPEPREVEHGGAEGVMAFVFDVSEQVRARQEVEASERRTRFLAEATRVMVAPLAPEAVLQRFAELAVPTLGDFCLFDVLTPQGEIHRVAWDHVEREKREWFGRVASLTPSVQDVRHPSVAAMRSGEPVFLPTLRRGWVRRLARDEEHRAFLERLNVTSVIAVPLTVGDDTLGALLFATDGSGDPERCLDEADLELAVELGRRAATALERAQRLESEREALREAEAAAERLHLLAETSAVLTSSFDIDDTLRRACRLIVAGQPDWCVVYLLDAAGDLQPAAVGHADPQREERAREVARDFPPERGVPGGFYEVLDGARPRVYGAGADEELRALARDATHLELLRGLGFRNGVAVPLVARAERLGVLALFSSSVSRRYGPEDVALAKELGRRIAAAVDNARLYREARELTGTLEQRVTDRTRELRGANVRLATTNRELEAFTYSVSHDLRAPLRGIDGFSAALLEDYGDRLDDVAIGYIERIRTGASRMGALIDDLLALARISRQAVRRRPVDLSAMAHRVLAELRERDPEREVEVSVAPGLRADGDDGLLQVLLDNLLGNAWKFTHGHDPARIVFDAERRDGATVFRVHDTGAGFDMAYADKLFAPFQRLHTDEVYEGTGIGLATVQRIVEQHGGAIWAEGVPGEGATFFFTLQGEGSSGTTSDPAQRSGDASR